MRVLASLLAVVAVTVGVWVYRSADSSAADTAATESASAVPSRSATGASGASGAESPPPDYAAKLESYSGHGEWVTYNAEDGAEITGYIAFPERPDAAPAMIVIHEIFGMSDFARAVAHDLAEAGYVALAPDLLSRAGGTTGADEARAVIRDLDPDGITADLDATLAYLRGLDAVSGPVGVIGFCWGGSQTFRYATNAADIDAAIVCYGGAPDADAMARIRAPVLGVYAENDARINASLPEVEDLMKAAGKSFEPEIYPGANHGFIRSRNVPDEADRAWANILAFLERELGN